MHNVYLKQKYVSLLKPRMPGTKSRRIVDSEVKTPTIISFIYALLLKKNLYKIDLILLLSVFITKTYLYNSDPLKPHFYIVKLGFIGVYIIFLISV